MFGAHIGTVSAGVILAASVMSAAVWAADATQPATDASMAEDRLIAAKTTALLNDPMTPVIGNPQADVAIVEFFDYTCPYCKAAEPRLEKLLKDDKRVKLIVKEFPILR